MVHVQKTLKKNVSFSGVGVHSGQPSSVTLWPAAPNTGVMFCNAANSDQVIKIGTVIPEAAMHATVIKKDGWYVSTIEHLMAALLMLGVDNVRIEVEGNEIPILDGSALLFAQGIVDTGFVASDVPRRFLTPRTVLNFADQQGRSLQLQPAAEGVLDFYIDYVAEFQHPLAGNPSLQGLVTPAFFLEQLAPARTFGFLEQLPFLRQHKLAQGSSLSNTVVIGQEPINDMRFADECVRHKVLDLVGDLSLLGGPLIGTIKAHKTSHNFNRLVIQHFVQQPELWALI